MAKPTSKLDWVLDDSAIKMTEPSSPLKTSGFTTDKPTFQNMNWLFNLTNKWIVYLETIADLVMTGGKSKQNNGITPIASGYLNSILMGTPRLKAAALSLTTGVETNVLSTAGNKFTVPAGSWTLKAWTGFTGNSNGPTLYQNSISRVSANQDSFDINRASHPFAGASSSLVPGDRILPSLDLDVDLAVDTDFFLVALCAFTTGNVSVYGGIKAIAR